MGSRPTGVDQPPINLNSRLDTNGPHLDINMHLDKNLAYSTVLWLFVQVTGIQCHWEVILASPCYVWHSELQRENTFSFLGIEKWHIKSVHLQLGGWPRCAAPSCAVSSGPCPG